MPTDLENAVAHSQQPNPVSVPHFRIEAGAPQVIRLGGFREVFDVYSSSLNQAICSFGTDNQVHCACDTLQGTMECEVPRTDATTSSVETGDMTIVAKIAEYETPPLLLRYNVVPFEDHNVLLRSATDDHNPAEKHDHDHSKHSRFLLSIQRDHLRKGSSHAYTLVQQCIAECIGTMFIVIFGVGSVCSAVLTNSLTGLWQVAVVWGFGVALAICSTASVSGAHLNPAVSLAMALFRPNDFPFRKLLPYWFAQYLGGIIGGAFNLLLYGPQFEFFEAENGIVRGEPSSVVTASAFGEYFPNPGFTSIIGRDVVSPAFAMMVEAWGTGILMFVILALTDPRQKLIHNKEMLPFYIGFTVAVLISLYAPLTQAGWNPARDFGPRVVAALAGWGRIAIPGPRNGFWVYIIGPKIGAPLGALLYDVLINPGLTD